MSTIAKLNHPKAMQHPGTGEHVMVIPIGADYLAFSFSEIEVARQRSKTLGLIQPEKPSGRLEDKILDANGMAKETGIPSTWFLEKARKGEISCIKAGTYVRFKLSVVINELAKERKTSRG